MSVMTLAPVFSSVIYVHIVRIAAAEDNDQLKEFVDSYAKFAKTCKGKKNVSPNFTKLSMANLPFA